ncbi:MAG: FadR family transcriptional regulator [Chloroflexota bacterium]|nr:FadR family transcriptional regulator [Chloroflexota bacterium]
MAPDVFKPVRDSRSHSDKIIEQIVDALLRGDLKPGDRMPTERDLAVRFSVSRTAVRDAIKILAGRGVVDVRHGSGIYIAANEATVLERLDQVDLHDALLTDLFVVRKVLETKIASLAADRRTERQVQRLRDNITEARFHAHDVATVSRLDAEFHLTLARASRNLVFIKLMLTVLDLLSRSREQTLSVEGRIARSLAGHERIVAAVADMQSERAGTAMLEHLDSVEASIAGTKVAG